ncbi:hypothetical protein F5884DRAFT_779145 [Xylogone sp. PMI_703]|nr:hypothetical protein F5884DRAFT_779145 [Xylogone sp. PMI_703]
MVNVKKYDFVSYEGSKLPRDPKIRDIIHRRAMRHVAAVKKQNGGQSKHNIGQYPPSIQESSDVDQGSCAASRSQFDGTFISHDGQDEATCVVSNDEPTRSSSENSRHMQLPLSTLCYPDPALSRSSSMLNLMAPLTVLYLGIPTLSNFTSGTSHVRNVFFRSLKGIFCQKRTLSYVPCRYGHVPSITHAADCLVASLEEILRNGVVQPVAGGADTLKPYIKALRSLQEAIDDSALRMTPETLCTVELLGLFEVLNGTMDAETWKRHAGAAARLIELRGPDHIKSDFELALFKAHIGPIITEAFLSGKNCFLTKSRWHKVISAAIHYETYLPEDQMDLIIKLWVHLSKEPNIFKSATDLICSSTSPEPEAVQDLIGHILEELDFHKEWLALAAQYRQGPWYDEFSTPAFSPDCNCAHSPVEQHNPWRVLQGTIILCGMIKMRLLSALSPLRFYEMEVECQGLADKIMRMKADFASYEDERFNSGIFLTETLWMAKGIIETREIWSESLIGTKVSNKNATGMIGRSAFEAWCKAIGRRVPEM